MRTHGWSVFLVAAVLVVGPAAGPSAADKSDAPSGKLTLWQHDNWGGHLESRAGYDSTFTNDACSGCDAGPGGDFSDDASSVWNRTGSWWILFEDSNYGGERLCLGPWASDNNIGNNTGFEDEISSVEKATTSKPVGCDDTIS